MKRIVITAALLACAFADAADAATLVNQGGRLTYTASGALPVYVSFSSGYQGDVRVYKQTYDHDAIVPTGCTSDGDPGFPVYSCPGVTAVTAIGGNENDVLDAQSLDIPFTADGGASDDNVSGGDAADSLSGGVGDDRLFGATADTLSGGPGLDAGFYTAPEKQLGPVSITLDGVADDGVAGDRLNFLADIEDVDADNRYEFNDPLPTYGPVTLAGTAGGNHLTGSNGPDTITGNGGIDFLDGEAGDDTLLARDGLADRVRCGTGTDTAVVDQFDQVSDTCEVVQRLAPEVILEDTPPTISWRAGSSLGVNAADDRGVVKVQWLDDDRVICTDTAAPFDCEHKPRIEDVGRNTVTAIATDTAGQTSGVTAARTVARFKPVAVSLQVKRSGRRYLATGKVTLPSGVPCSGSVKVGSKTGKLGSSCAFRIAVPRAAKYVASYLGTDAIAPARSKTRRV